MRHWKIALGALDVAHRACLRACCLCALSGADKIYLHAGGPSVFLMPIMSLLICTMCAMCDRKLSVTSDSRYYADKAC